MGSALLVHIPGYFSRLGATEGSIGFLYGCAAVMALAVRPGLGRTLDLRPRRRVLLTVGMVDVLLIISFAMEASWGSDCANGGRQWQR
jgi:hypothetical protein